MNILGFFLVLACLPSALVDYALPVWKAESNFQIEDAYKWLYQATRGGEHAVPDRETAKKYLDEEWKALTDAQPNEPLWQPLCADESISRLNLRPFRAKGGKLDGLLDGFLESSSHYATGEADFLAAWKDLGKRLKRESYGNLTAKAWKNLNREMKKKDYPAIHHSVTYERAQHPAYRVLTLAASREVLESLK